MPDSKGNLKGQGWSREREHAWERIFNSRLERVEVLDERGDTIGTTLQVKCRTCVEYAGRIHPPHNAKPNCKSGGHSHCSCDTCF